MISRREFLKSTLATLVAAVVPNTAFAEENKFDYLAVYDSEIESVISQFSNVHNDQVPERNLVKAMIAVETGSPAHRQTAFLYDPMQIANEGDFALDVLANGKENTHLVGDFSSLKGKTKTPRKNGEWDYSNSNMTSSDSIRGGVGWLIHKRAIYGNRTAEDEELHEYKIAKGDNYSKIAGKLGTTVESLTKNNPSLDPKKLRIGQKIKYKKSTSSFEIIGWRSWDEAVERYNGGGNKNYLAEVLAVKAQLDSI